MKLFPLRFYFRKIGIDPIYFINNLICSCQRTSRLTAWPPLGFFAFGEKVKRIVDSSKLYDVFPRAMVGLTGLEPVTLRLSSACSNQLSYRPLYKL